MIFAASPGDIIGPVATDNGWYVAKIGEPRLDIASPSDLEAIRNEYFLAWVRARLDDPSIVEAFENWQDFTPIDPMPQDVSPLLRTENFIFNIDEDPFASFEQ
jgi:hypothetical protein